MWLEEKDLNGWGLVGQVMWEMNGEESTGWQRETGLTLPKGQKDDSSVNVLGMKYSGKDEKTV